MATNEVLGGDKEISAAMVGRLLALTDLTTLEATDHVETVEALCRKALAMRPSVDGVERSVATVCVYPVFASAVRRMLEGSGIRTAVVAGGFPSAQMLLRLRAEECRIAIEEGAEEIDMVISRGRFLGGDVGFLTEEVGVFAGLCKGKAVLKVILETGELQREELIRLASRLSLEAGADFIKTSTGKVMPGATPEAFAWMLDEVVHHYEQTGLKRGVKVSGGISEPAVAAYYYRSMANRVGQEWMTERHFRLGASRLADKLVAVTGSSSGYTP